MKQKAISDTPETDAVWESNKNKPPIELEAALCECSGKLERERNKYRAALADLHATIQRLMSDDEPTPEDMLATWSAWKAAGKILEDDAESIHPESKP